MISKRWSQWQTVEDDRRCKPCKDKQGKIFKYLDLLLPYRPLHPYCRCRLIEMKQKKAGTVTNRGLDGADWWIANKGRLPDYYLTKTEAVLSGWVASDGNLADICPGMMIGGNIFRNIKGQLPEATGRVWYEADFNYQSGYRGGTRIVYSNDGLMFATYDHYRTWVEIVN